MSNQKKKNLKEEMVDFTNQIMARPGTQDGSVDPTAGF